MFNSRKSDKLFFDLFSKVIEDTCTAAEILEDLFRNYQDIEEKIKILDVLEHKCDKTVHDLIKHLNRCFITPFDREDIFLLSKIIDNIMDDIESTGHRLTLFSITQIKAESFEVTGLIMKCTKELKQVIDELAKMKSSKVIHARIVEVNRIENQGDVIYRKVIKNLFAVEKDPIEIIKWKEIYEFMEKTLDDCEDVANVIEGIVSKNA